MCRCRWVRGGSSAAAPTAARSGFRGFVGEKKAGNGVGVSQPLRLLVDSRVHAEELARFEALVVRGPGADDCAIWKGAIGGDGYVSNRAVKKSVRQPFPMIAGCGTSTMVSAVRLVRSSRRTPRQQIQSSHRLACAGGHHQVDLGCARAAPQLRMLRRRSSARVDGGDDLHVRVHLLPSLRRRSLNGCVSQLRRQLVPPADPTRCPA